MRHVGESSQDDASTAHSPRLVPHHTNHLDALSDEDVAPHDTSALWDESDSDSTGLGDDKAHNASKEKARNKLHEVEHRRETGNTTPSDDTLEGLLPRDKQRRTALYDYAAEKQMSHAESKLFYQRSQNEAQEIGGAGSLQNADGLTRAMTAPSMVGEPGTLSRTGSLRSRQSTRSFIHTQGSIKSGVPTSLVNENDLAGITSMHESSQGNDDHEHSSYIATVERSAGQSGNVARSQTSNVGPSREHEDVGLHAQSAEAMEAAIGVGNTSGGFADRDGNIKTELSEIYTRIQRVLDLRHKYIRLSLQGPSDNPKDDPAWQIYPPPPEPAWEDEKERYGANAGTDSMTNSGIISSESATRFNSEIGRPLSSTGSQANLRSPIAPLRRRKPGQNIGEDFDLADLLIPEASEMTFQLDENSVYQVYENATSAQLDTPVVNIPTLREFYMDLDQISNVSSDGPSKSFAFRRLQYLEGKFNLYMLLNEYQEVADSKRVPHRDFYNVRKVDTHVHHSACMNQKHLLRFIKSKMKKCPDEVVLDRDGKRLTLREVFESINLTAYDLSIDTLDMHVSSNKYCPLLHLPDI